jgi:arsenate reductase
MAEGLLEHLGGHRFEVYSAGSEPAGYVHSLAVQVMREIGIDISDHTSKPLNQFLGQPFDYVITVCDRANEACPFMPGHYKRLHRDFFDPAKAEGTEQEKLAVFRQVRDEIKAWLVEIFDIGDVDRHDKADAG